MTMTLEDLLSYSRLNSLDKVVQVELPDNTYRDIKEVVYVEGRVVIRLEPTATAE